MSCERNIRESFEAICGDGVVRKRQPGKRIDWTAECGWSGNASTTCCFWSAEAGQRRKITSQPHWRRCIKELINAAADTPTLIICKKERHVSPVINLRDIPRADY